jgi:hypothetical protein
VKNQKRLIAMIAGMAMRNDDGCRLFHYGDALEARLIRERDCPGKPMYASYASIDAIYYMFGNGVANGANYAMYQVVEQRKPFWISKCDPNIFRYLTHAFGKDRIAPIEPDFLHAVIRNVVGHFSMSVGQVWKYILEIFIEADKVKQLCTLLHLPGMEMSQAFITPYSITSALTTIFHNIEAIMPDHATLQRLANALSDIWRLFDMDHEKHELWPYEVRLAVVIATKLRSGPPDSELAALHQSLCAHFKSRMPGIVNV